MTMKIKQVLVMLVLLSSTTFKAQTVGKYLYKGKEYFVYPFRISDDAIPEMGYKIPDGNYVVFEVYNFKRKRFAPEKRKYKLTDTTKIAGFITIKNNLPEDSAVFFSYDTKENGVLMKKPDYITQGRFVKGEKEGPWKVSETEYGSYDIDTYKQSLRNGYRYEYNSTGQLQKKEKYRDGKLCDTVFSYSNGRLYCCFDFCPPEEYTMDLSVYGAALKFLNLTDRGRIKSFYREYDEQGKATIDLRFKNGIVFPFDSLDNSYMDHFDKYRTTRYVTIKKTGEDEMVMTDYFDSKEEQSVSTRYYKKGFLYKTTETKTEKIRIKKWFRKEKFIELVVDPKEWISVDPETIDNASTEPVLIQKSLEYNKTMTTYYIPKYHFIYVASASQRFAGVDPSRSLIFCSKDEQRYLSPLKRTDLMAYGHNDTLSLLNFKMRPFMQKEYIVIQIIHNDINYNRGHYPPDVGGYSTRGSFRGICLGSTYYKNDSLLSGMTCFSKSKRPKGFPKNGVHFKEYFSEDYTKGILENGLKEGPWEELNLENDLKYTPLDFSSYFFSHPKNVRNYEATTYHNGLRNGHSTIYLSDQQRYRKHKAKNILYKSRETDYKNDTLNGPFKEYYSNNQLKTDANFVMGKPNGAYKIFNSNGNPQAFIQFDHGNLNGPYISYDRGKPSITARFKNNQLMDTLTYFNLKGHPFLMISANADTLKFKKQFFENGQLKEEAICHPNSHYLIGKECISSDNFIEMLSGINPSLRETNASYKNYYENGQLLSTGEIRNGQPYGKWKFYNINGALIHDVDFQDTSIALPHSGKVVEIAGYYTGYYSGGKLRSKGYLFDLELSYDCFTKQDKAALDYYVLDFYDNTGKQTIKNGNGYFIKYDENGLRQSQGKIVNCIEDSVWRYYTPEQKLTITGTYVNGNREGVWYEGDLEGINFEDGACFDMNDPAEIKAYNEKRKDLKITKLYYVNGQFKSSTNFNSNLNKTYKPRRGHHGYSF